MDKQVTLKKFKGNQKQFEHNAQIDSMFDRLTSANVPEKKGLTDLNLEGKELIRKRQKLIRIADKSADGWRVVEAAWPSGQRVGLAIQRSRVRVQL